MKNALFLFAISLLFTFGGCSSSDSQSDGDADFNSELDPDVDSNLDSDLDFHEEDHSSGTFFYPRPEEPLYGDCVPGVAACSEDRSKSYLCDSYGRWMLWAEYREPVECSICSDYMDMNTRTVDGKILNQACSHYPEVNNHNKFTQRPVPALYIIEDWDEGAAYDCFGEGFRQFDPIECNGESGNLEIPYSGDRVHWQTKFKDQDQDSVDDKPACSYRLEIPCAQGCVIEDFVGGGSYFDERREDYEMAHCIDEKSMVVFNPGLPHYLKEGLGCDKYICKYYSMRLYHGICIPDDSPYCMRWDNENDCPAGKDCIDGICQPFDPNNVPQPPDGDLDQEPDADPDPETDGDGELVTEADETETETELE